MSSTLVAPAAIRDIETTTLPNGVKIITEAMPHVRSVSVGIWINAGSRRETPEQNGVSHIVEHMLFKGTERYEKGEIDLITVNNGGSNNAFTWLDFTAYYFTFASDRWQIALEIESDRMGLESDRGRAQFVATRLREIARTP